MMTKPARNYNVVCLRIPRNKNWPSYKRKLHLNQIKAQQEQAEKQKTKTLMRHMPYKINGTCFQNR